MLLDESWELLEYACFKRLNVVEDYRGGPLGFAPSPQWRHLPHFLFLYILKLTSNLKYQKVQ
jgi:hypothetical protein